MILVRGTHIGFFHRLPSPDCFPLGFLVLLLLLMMFMLMLALLTFVHFLTKMLTRCLPPLSLFFFPINQHNLTEVNATSVICSSCLCQLASQLEVISSKCLFMSNLIEMLTQRCFSCSLLSASSFCWNFLRNADKTTGVI